MKKNSKIKKKFKKKNKKIFQINIVNQEQPPNIPVTMFVANQYLEKVNFVGFINDNVVWDEKQCKVDPGTLAKAVILSTFKEIRAPLYKIEDNFKGIDTEALLGVGVLPEYLNDDAIANMLDRIFQAKTGPLFSTLSLSCHTEFNIPFKRMHSDTTTLSFYGEYQQCENETDNEEGEVIKVVKGYNKDHLPHCKQIVVGKIVNEHGIALVNSNMDGNTSDIDWNNAALKLVKDIFGEKMSQMIYIADCKLINLPTFKILMDPEQEIKFISRCPNNFSKKIAEKLIQEAHKDNNWQEVGQISPQKNACTYHVQEYKRQVADYEVRFVVVKSSAGKEKAERKLAKDKIVLENAIIDLNKKIFACEADALEEWARFQKEHKKSFHQFTAQCQKIETIKRPRGNPGKNPKPPIIEINWRISITIEGQDEERVKNLNQAEESFVLIANVSENELGSDDILREYKGQHVVESQFRLLKEPALASTIFLKTPCRIDALTMLLNVSLLIRALIQYQIRKSVQESQEELPRIGRDKGKLVNPTISYVIDTLSPFNVIKDTEGGYVCNCHSSYDVLRVETIFSLLELDFR